MTEAARVERVASNEHKYELRIYINLITKQHRRLQKTKTIAQKYDRTNNQAQRRQKAKKKRAIAPLRARGEL